MPIIADCPIIDHYELAPDIFRLEMEAPSIVQEAWPGQFVLIKCSQSMDPLLRRPFSIHEVRRDTGLLAILYQVRGKGTQWLSERRPGSRISVLGPLGRGFAFPADENDVLLLAGGIGIAPLLFYAQELSGFGLRPRIMAGARNSSLLVSADRFRELGLELDVATDDGSTGFPGTVVELFVATLPTAKPGLVTACGPTPMLASLSRILRQEGIPGQVSLETQLACGIGACRGCAVPLNRGLAAHYYVRACVEGPVFKCDEVDWDGL